MSIEQSSGYDPHISILLYPEWDEFYLLVCDICGMIIMPKALEKHLARKHRIVKVNGKNIENKSDEPSNNSSNSCCSNDGSSTSNNSAFVPPPASIVNGTELPEIETPIVAASSNIVDPIFYDLEPPSPSITTTSKSSSSTASSISSASSSTLSLNHPAIRSSPSHSISSRYQQDRKWRNTYNVLRDTFF